MKITVAVKEFTYSSFDIFLVVQQINNTSDHGLFKCQSDGYCEAT